VEIAYEQGILSTPNISKIQRWALSYFINETKRAKAELKAEELKESWKTQLWIADQQRYDRMFNPGSGVMDEHGNQTDAEQGFDDPEEIDMDALMKQLSGELSTRDSSLSPNQQWR
jgi:hypothetical protein